MRKQSWLALSCFAIACCSLVIVNIVRENNGRESIQAAPFPVVLYTAPHGEMAPFQSVWNPDTNSDYTPKDFSMDEDDSKDDGDKFLCGDDGRKCPEVPSFNGEDYFDSKPIGYNGSFFHFFNPYAP